MKKKIMLAALTLLVAGLFSAGTASAVPILGGQIYSNGGNVVVQVLPASAGYTSDLELFFLDGSTPIYIANNREIGRIVDLGSFAAGEELVFGIYVRNTGDTFLMGPGSRNSDRLEHAVVDFLAPGLANVGFEDLWGGGDRDYDDNVFQFRGGIAPNPVPEPATLLFLGSGLLGLAVARRRSR